MTQATITLTRADTDGNAGAEYADYVTALCIASGI
jgi:hypothetical protein